MNKKILIGSILAVALLTLVSLSNVVGYQSVKTSQEDIITSEFDFDECKDYLFETLVDISNNPEVKDLINSNNNLIPNNRVSPIFRRYSNQASLSVEHLELLYKMGLKIIDRLGEDKVAELMENIEIGKQEYLDDLDAIIMGNNELKERIYTLNKLNNENMTLICLIINIIMVVSLFIKVNFVQMFIYNPIHYILDNVLNIQGTPIWYFILWTISVPLITISMIPILLLFNVFQCDYIDIPNP